MDINKRIYLTCFVLTTTPLIELQKSLNDRYKDFKPINPTKFHLTIFHYGKPQELYSEIKVWSPSITFDAFIEKLSNTLNNIDYDTNLKFQTYGNNITKEIARGDFLDEFGNGSVLVLRVNIPENILKIRKSIFIACEEFLRNCGISNTVSFMNTSENLKWQVIYSPHISLGFIGASYIDSGEDVKNITLELGPIEIVR